MKLLVGAHYQRWFADVLDTHEEEVVELSFCGFSLDAKGVVGGVCSVPSEAIRRVLVDRRQTFADMGTKQQYSCLLQLQKAGVAVRVGQGSSVSEGYQSRGRTTGVGPEVMGRLHAKSAYIRLGPPSHQEILFIGSCNWTDASVCNYEVSVCLTNPDPQVIREWKTEFDLHWDRAGALDEVAVQEHRAVQRSPTRRSRNWE